MEKAKEQGELQLQSHAMAKEQVVVEVLRELEKSADTETIETGVQKFVEWIRSGKLEIKAHPAENLHAKVYIMTFVEGDRIRGASLPAQATYLNRAWWTILNLMLS
jgi:hypothetical protein